jgi:heme exporter protein B
LGLLRQAWAIFRKDLQLEWRSFDNLSGMFFFSLLILVIFNFTFDLTDMDFTEMGPGIIWITLTFAGVLAISHSFQIEREEECAQGLLLSPADPGAIYIGKAMSNLAVLLLAQLILVPLTALLFNFSLQGKIWNIAIVLLVHILGFAGVGTLLGAITARTRRADFLFPLLLFTTCVPIIISAVKTTSVVLEGRPLADASNWLQIAGAFDAIMLAASFLIFGFVIEE